MFFDCERCKGGYKVIFVTVGTHEQPFNRLIEYIDDLKGKKIIQEDVVIQSGFSTYKPKHCKWSKLFAYQEMRKIVDDARIIITHGGPSSFIMPLQIGKIPIVVPRQKRFNEHINDHQVTFTKAAAEKMGTIIVVINVEHLGNVVSNYDKIIAQMPSKLNSNNARFCERFEQVVYGLMRG